jgi:protein SCO1/2
MHLRSLVLILAAASALLASAARGAERIFDVNGVVRAPLKGGRVVIAHDDIPGFMPAMTMGFAVANPTEATSLAVGDRVQFRLTVSETTSTATDFKVVGRAPGDPSGATPQHTSRRLREGDRVPPFSLIDQEGQTLAAAALSGHATVVTFIFSRCPIPEYCPAMALRFGQLQRAILANPHLTDRARLLSISIDPEFDRPEILKAYGTAVGADPAIWRFATGEKTEIAALCAAFAVFTERNGLTLDHTLCTALIDRNGRVSELWRGNGWKVEEVIAALARVDTE